ncbi:hypothetical protein JX265_006727 [Neoarthrinium moseri]|uniref:3-hydroxyisobutyrate dehydrogenase protein n=1 Tax=Neoarthrinium moseri TaxID=1658444 RepID=A0A9Q0AP11_9PEZI|nr:hypothetical protein JX266_006954 [Neoarthrinium moseri]KAI1868748.1 hypothetical protein JX265_006727 [Neoarthrinium moseri]
MAHHKSSGGPTSADHSLGTYHHDAAQRQRWDDLGTPKESISSSPADKSANCQATQSEFPTAGDPSAVSSEPVKQSSQKRWWQWSKAAEHKLLDNLNDQFSGKRGWNGHFYYKPRKPDQEHQDHTALGDADYGGSLKKDDEGKFEYLNQFGQKSSKYSDVSVYLSPTNFIPKRLVVQSTDYVLRNKLATGDWRRRQVNGDVPTVLAISEWALGPFGQKAWWHKVDGSLRLLVVCVPLQICLAWPGASSWKDEDTIDTYTDFPGYHWQWAKHAINPLDQKPVADKPIVAPQLPSSRQRLIRPRQLVVQQDDGSWKVDANAPASMRYIFVSFADKAFASSSGRKLIQQMAASAARDAGCKAYWLDFLCRAENNGDLLDSDVYRMCDVIRGCKRVVVMLPDARVESKRIWGSRMWTLPEALLAPGNRCYFCTPDGEGHRIEELSLVEMTSEVWEDPIDSESDGGSTRLLAEHYANLLTLSRLELFATALDALGHRSEKNYKFYTPNDVTYALMGLLHYRIERDNTDTEFQSLAQLSLGNDSDRIVERMISLYPHPNLGPFKPFRTLARPDLFHTHLWDIEPSCQVVGVAHENNTVLLDNCRAMHIRWKGFPRPVVARDVGFRRLMAAMFVTAGTWWFVQGIALAVYYAPFISTENAEQKVITIIKWMVAGFVFVAVTLSVTGPFSVRRLYGGQVLQSTSNLVAFEGVMPISKLECLVFGNNSSRLSYEASSTPFSQYYRHQSRRVGFEPDWIRDERPDLVEANLPKGHKLFTLVDTGELSVSIFSAERPPTVALLCGREGGMLRAVLCSWQFENDCLYKETVVRMPSNVWNAATPKGWLKICLGTMDQEREAERTVKLERMRKEKDIDRSSC